ncbi:hypothetical protein D3C85_1294600 [compost metagenome]
MPALFYPGDEPQLLECHHGLLLFVEQGAGAQGEGRGAQIDPYLPQGQMQTIVFRQPVGQVPLDEAGGLPQQDGERDEQGRAEIQDVAQQASGQRLGHDGLHLMRSW